MSRAVVAVLFAASLLACGKYGPPVRASAQKPPEKKSFEIPLPGAAAPAASPAATPAVEEEPPPVIEEEPPPEGAP